MHELAEIDVAPLRRAMMEFAISPNVAPNETIDLERVFFPASHRNVLDFKRQLVVGNRGMGKSFWTHALTNPEVRERLANEWPKLRGTKVVIGFNGSVKISGATPTVEQLDAAFRETLDSELIWRAVIVAAVRSLQPDSAGPGFVEVLTRLKVDPGAYAEELTRADDQMVREGSQILVVFDALDRFSKDWSAIRKLTKGLLATAVGLQSFRAIRAKVFMRVDQFADKELFSFPDSSKIRNDYVALSWTPHELFGLLLFEMLRVDTAAPVLRQLADYLQARYALPTGGHQGLSPREQELLINAIAGEYMGRDRKRGRVYTWVPLHLGDAMNNCSPRTFLTAWKTAAEHLPPPQRQAVDHLGIIEGVRRASSVRLTELEEDYPWIKLVLEPLRKHFVPIEEAELFDLWRDQHVTKQIEEQSSRGNWLAPIGVFIERSEQALLQTMTSIAVMEKRANGKINVPDIFRVEAGILRKGGVAVPRKG